MAGMSVVGNMSKKSVNIMTLFVVMLPIRIEHKLAELPQMVVSDGNVQVEVSPQEKNYSKHFLNMSKPLLATFTDLANQYRIPLLPFNTVEDTDKQLCRALGVDI